jgi:outer membrane protein assembly factor BamD
MALLALAGCGASVLPSIHSEAERLAVAQRLHAKGDNGDAIELLKTYIANNGGSADVDHAIYLLGACYLSARDWASAANEYERLLRDYPESDSGAAGRFRLGEALFGQAKGPDFDQDYTQKALDAWQQYLRDYPGHWLNPEAERRVLMCRTRLADKIVKTGELYLQLKLPAPARLYFERVTSEFSDTSATPRAQLGLAICDARQGKKPEAIARLKDLETRFTRQPMDERAARERKRLERS